METSAKGKLDEALKELGVVNKNQIGKITQPIIPHPMENTLLIAKFSEIRHSRFAIHDLVATRQVYGDVWSN